MNTVIIIAFLAIVVRVCEAFAAQDYQPRKGFFTGPVLTSLAVTTGFFLFWP